MGTSVDFHQGQRQFMQWQGAPDQFLAAMPEEWRADFRLYLESCADRMELFVITDNGQIIAGGIVMNGLPPEMKRFEKDIKHYIEKGYLYIGFLFVATEYRKQNIGSTWLRHITEAFDTQGFWLTVEDVGLIEFYEKNGFGWKGTLTQDQLSEELLVFEPYNGADNPTKSH